MRHRQRGFGPTQIETIGIVVLIGIVAIAFIPSYFNTMIFRAIIEAMDASQPMRDYVGESIADGKVPLASQVIEQRFAERLVDGKLIEKLAVAEDGTIEIQFGQKMAGAQGSSLMFTPAIEAGGPVKWSCIGGSLEERYRPDSCPRDEPPP